MQMAEPLFLEPVFYEKIWGGTGLRDEFGYDIPSDHTGEAWAISAHPHGQASIKNGPYQGMKLNELWDQHRELFGNAKGDVFPLLTKILDANQDLSVQVHPDNEYARIHEGELGKTEVKLLRAESSWWETACEDRALPRESKSQTEVWLFLFY